MNSDNFYSIDRLVEFGLGVGIAQQMVSSMNSALQGTHIPGIQTPLLNQRTHSTYFAILDEKQAGPFSEEEISRLISQGKIGRNSYLWRPGMARWDHAENIPDVLRIVALTPPPFNPTGEDK